MFTAKKMPSGNLLVEVENQEQSKAFLIVDFIWDYKANVTPRCSLYIVCGVMCEGDPDDSEEEL